MIFFQNIIIEKFKSMVFLKEDGSLDIERINELPIDEYITVIESLTESQRQYYNSHLPVNDGTQHTKAVFVDYTLVEELKHGAVILEDYLNENIQETEYMDIEEARNFFMQQLINWRSCHNNEVI